ncbi:MAG: hypothetical protein KAR40_12150 [Candidatus Sabulitectum sp.]|nr:hypothetical protein [Candidatus Sabulitectum sp.]
MSITVYIAAISILYSQSSASALIFHTSDGGKNWARENSATPNNLNGVSVDIVSGIALAVGDKGTILRRNEDGTWVNVSPDGLSADLYSVAAGVSSIMCCGADGTLLSSFDGGFSWRVWTDFGYENTDLYSINFDPTHPGSFLIAGENGFIYSSEEGELVQTGSSSDFIASCGMLCGGFPEIVLGRDGTAYHIRSDVNYNIGDTVFRGATEIVSGGGRYIAVGENGAVYRSLSDGVWESASSVTTENLNDVTYLVWGLTACAVGDCGTVLVSDDNGLTWGIVDIGMSRDFTAIAGNGAGEAYIVGKSAFSGILNILPFRGASH